MEHIKNTLNTRKYRPKVETGHLPIRPTLKKTRLYLDKEYIMKKYCAVFPHSVTSVYSVLAMFANHEKQVCFPSAETIMEYCGITNRRTLFEAIKILEAYNIVSIVHNSKGKITNVYALLDVSVWKEANSGNFVTVRKELRANSTVTKTNTQQLQKEDSNSGTSATLSNLSESTKESKVDIQKEIPIGMHSELTKTYEDSDILNTYRELVSNGNGAPSFVIVKLALNSRVVQGKIKRKTQHEQSL